MSDPSSTSTALPCTEPPCGWVRLIAGQARAVSRERRRHTLRCSVFGRFVSNEGVAGSSDSWIVPDPVVCESCFRRMEAPQ